jgi:hypothetical protein
MANAGYAAVFSVSRDRSTELDMPHRKRSLRITVTLFGFLAVLGLIGLSSGRLRADTPAGTTPVSMEIQAMADDFAMRHPGVRGNNPAGAAPQRLAQSREQCEQACLQPYYECMRAGHSNAQCNKIIRSCRANC